MEDDEILELKAGQFGFRLLWLVGLLGKLPMPLARYMNGYYDYNRRAVTQLVREGYPRERKFERYDRHKIRSLSLTEKGLKHIQHLSPGRATSIRKHLPAPADGQGSWELAAKIVQHAMLRTPNCPFVRYVGTKKLVKRREFEAYISKKLVI